MCCWNQFAERAGECEPKPSSIIYSLAHRSIYSKPFSLMRLCFPVATLRPSGAALKRRKAEPWLPERTYIFARRRVRRGLAANKQTGSLWQIEELLQRQSWGRETGALRPGGGCVAGYGQEWLTSGCRRVLVRKCFLGWWERLTRPGGEHTWGELSNHI